MADSSILLKQFDGSNYSQYFPQNLPLDIANQFVNSQGKNSNDIFNYLRKYCQYWWRKTSQTTLNLYHEAKGVFSPAFLVCSSTRTIKWSKSITINSSRTISLMSPSNLSVEASYIGAENLAKKAPCYITNLQGGSSKVFYLEENTSGGTSASKYNIYTSDNKVYLSENDYHCKEVSAVKITVPEGTISYEQSTMRNAYPDSSIENNYSYSFLGVPLEEMTQKIDFNIQIGQYIGTGTFGPKNPNVLSFSKAPQVLMFQNNKDYNSYNWGLCFPKFQTALAIIYKAPYTNQSLMAVTVNTIYKNNNKTIMWYIENSDSNEKNAYYQGNLKDSVYSYFALF